MSEDPNRNPFGESPANGTPDPKNPFQFAAGGAKTETPPSPFEISSSNPFAAPEKAKEEEKPKQGGEGFEMKGFPEEPKPMGQLEAAPVEPAKPAPPAVPAKPEAKTEPAKPAPAPPAPAPSSIPAPSPLSDGLPTTETKQLVLRAIFGVDHELSHQQILQRARTLPGVKNLSAVDAEAIAALGKVRSLVGSIGLGSADDLVLSNSEGVFDFISAGSTTLAILRDGEYAAGVRETLILIAQELDKL